MKILISSPFTIILKHTKNNFPVTCIVFLASMPPFRETAIAQHSPYSVMQVEQPHSDKTWVAERP